MHDTHFTYYMHYTCSTQHTHDTQGTRVHSSCDQCYVTWAHLLLVPSCSAKSYFIGAGAMVVFTVVFAFIVRNFEVCMQDGACGGYTSHAATMLSF